MSKATMFDAFDRYVRANFKKATEAKTRLSHSLHLDPIKMDDGRSVVYFVTSDAPEHYGDKRLMTIRAMIIEHDGSKSFTTFGAEHSYKARKPIERAFAIFQDSDMRHFIDETGAIDVIPKDTKRSLAPVPAAMPAAPEAAPKAAKEIKRNFSAKPGEPGYVPNYERPTRNRLDFKDWPDEEKLYNWLHRAPGFLFGSVNAARVAENKPPIPELWACECRPDSGSRYMRWQNEGGEAKLAESLAVDDSEATGSGVKEEWSARSETGKQRIAKAIGNIGELFEDSGEAFMYLQDSGLSDMAQVEFEELVRKAGKA